MIITGAILLFALVLLLKIADEWQQTKEHHVVHQPNAETGCDRGKESEFGDTRVILLLNFRLITNITP